jgi:hypothetical protein
MVVFSWLVRCVLPASMLVEKRITVYVKSAWTGGVHGVDTWLDRRQLCWIESTASDLLLASQPAGELNTLDRPGGPPKLSADRPSSLSCRNGLRRFARLVSEGCYTNGATCQTNTKEGSSPRRRRSIGGLYWLPPKETRLTLLLEAPSRGSDFLSTDERCLDIVAASFTLTYLPTSIVRILWFRVGLTAPISANGA